MATICRSLSRMARVRLTRLDECGAPAPGTTGTLVTNAFINVDAAPNYLDPEEITQLNGNGDLCIDDQGVPQLRWLDLTMVLCQIDPFAVNIITGNPLVVNDNTPTPDTVGFRINGELTGTVNFAMEIWMGIPSQSCTTTLGREYGYWLFPFITQARVGDWSHANAALNLTFTARTSVGSQWNLGPTAYTVRDDAVSGTPERILTAIDNTDHVHYEVVTAAPPTAACGAIALVA
jgi:hypothetical protein